MIVSESRVIMACSKQAGNPMPMWCRNKADNQGIPAPCSPKPLHSPVRETKPTPPEACILVPGPIQRSNQLTAAELAHFCLVAIERTTWSQAIRMAAVFYRSP